MTMTFTPNNTIERATARSLQRHADLQARSTHVATARVQQPATGMPSINLVLAAAVAIAIVFALVIGLGGDAAANGPLQPVSPDSQMVDAIEVYVVQQGDTLWAIATEVARPGEDVRPIVDSLKELTGGSSLDVGQRIVIDHTTIRG